MFEPNYNTIVSTLTQPFEYLVETTNSFIVLEKDLVPLVDINKVPSYQISVELDCIREGISKITEYVKEGFKEPLSILNQFKNYQFLLERSVKEVLKQLFPDGKEKIVIDLLEKEIIERGLKDYTTAKDEILKLCVDEKNCRFFRVKTLNCKQVLENKANEVLKEILTKVAVICSDNVEMISLFIKK